MSLAPIVLFVYNRPWHTEQTLIALEANDLAKESVLYIYADGAKKGADDEMLNKIAKTRKIIKSKLWCKEVIIVEAKKNHGLANSVIKGVSEIIDKHKKIIVLEDDIVTANGFLRFMNDSLRVYEKVNYIAGVSGWSYPIQVEDEIYFSKTGSCWGWATWSRVWEELNFSSLELLEKVNLSQRVKEFNVDGAYDFYSMLDKQSKGKIDSWAVRFYANYFLTNSLFLFPQKSLVTNVGFDGSGTNYTLKLKSEIPYVSFEKHFVKVTLVNNPEETPLIRKKIVAYLKTPSEISGFLARIISRIKRLLS